MLLCSQICREFSTAKEEVQRIERLAAEAVAKKLPRIPNLDFEDFCLLDCRDPIAAARVWPLARIICDVPSSKRDQWLHAVSTMTRSDVVPLRARLLEVIADMAIMAFLLDAGLITIEEDTKKAPRAYRRGRKRQGGKA